MHPHRCIAPTLLMLAGLLPAAEIVLPLERTAYYCQESIEVAVTSLAKGTTARVVVAPLAPGKVTPVEWTVTGDGGTVNAILAPFSIAPGKYAISVDGAGALPLTVVTGVASSTMLVSQTGTKGRDGGANFILSNAFGFGRIDKDGQPLIDSRGKFSSGLRTMDEMVAADLPAICYMYWTGFVTHKPWGTEKSWANAEVQESMRLFNFSIAHRLRRFAPLWHIVGPIDEPGLSWGKTPAGGMASGFPNWDEKPWYEARGVSYTQDIANYSSAEWTRYNQVRGGIIKESYEQASKDLKTVMPDLIFGGDLYAPAAVMDGTDSLNHQANDIPTSHVFFDWTSGPMTIAGGFQLETCAIPGAKLAHAMNGQLEGARGPQRPLYHWLMNAMLQGGMHSNWWLNTAGMSTDDLTAVNNPVATFGPLFQELELGEHDVTVMWGFSELLARQHDMVKRESTKKNGEQIKLMLPVAEEISDGKNPEVDSNAYEIGGTYQNQVLGLHQTLRRAGYAPQMLHEAVLTTHLKDRRVLCIVEQTVPLSATASTAIAAFIANGGVVFVDQSTTTTIPGATVMPVTISANAWRVAGAKRARQAAAAPTKTEATQFEMNMLSDDMWRTAVGPVKKALQSTTARPVLTTESRNLSVERHLSGQTELIMVLNGNEAVPKDLAPGAAYPRYNPAPATHTYTLQGIAPTSHVWCVEGLDWKRITKIENPSNPITADFSAGEMKLYVVVPKTPEKFDVTATNDHGIVKVHATIKDLSVAWPISITIAGPGGELWYGVTRSFDTKGQFTEGFPLGTNAVAGNYTITVTGLIGEVSATTSITLDTPATLPTQSTDIVRFVDHAHIEKFLAQKPHLVIAVGTDEQLPIAENLADKLTAKGIAVTVQKAAAVLEKSSYPRIMNPFVQVYSVGGDEKKPSGDVTRTIVLDDSFTGNLRVPKTLATVGVGGWMDYLGLDKEVGYEAGTKLYVDEKGGVTVLNAVGTKVPADAAFKARWSKPWHTLSSYNGGYQLPPQLPEAFTTASHLIVLGDSSSNSIARAVIASEIYNFPIDAKYPGPGKAMVQFAWSPFALEKNLILIGASDVAGITAGADALVRLAR